MSKNYFILFYNNKNFLFSLFIRIISISLYFCCYFFILSFFIKFIYINLFGRLLEIILNKVYLTILGFLIYLRFFSQCIWVGIGDWFSYLLFFILLLIFFLFWIMFSVFLFSFAVYVCVRIYVYVMEMAINVYFFLICLRTV